VAGSAVFDANRLRRREINPIAPRSTSPTVSIEADAFERHPCHRGLIDYNGSIELHSSLLNVILHDEPHIEI
jgi:hypothetical protein